MSESLVLLGIAMSAASGIIGWLTPRSSNNGQLLTTLLAVLGSAVGLSGVGAFWATGVSVPLTYDWLLVPGAQFSVAVDGLSAFFLVPIFLISLLCNIYGLDYWKETEHPDN